MKQFYCCTMFRLKIGNAKILKLFSLLPHSVHKLTEMGNAGHVYILKVHLPKAIATRAL
jgi:intracellular sulfur oxidation DsrE/DsrF family protein